MESKINTIIKETTLKLTDLFSDSAMDDREKERIVSVYCDRLIDNIGNLDKMDSCETLIHSASVEFIDDQINAVISSDNATYAQYEMVLKMCERQEENFSLFADKGWKLPDIKNTDIRKSKDTLRAKMGIITQNERMLGEYRLIMEKMDLVRKKASVKSCDEVLKLIEKLDYELKQNNQSIQSLTNAETSLTDMVQEIKQLRQQAEKKENLKVYIKETDKRLTFLNSCVETSKERTQEILALCQQQIGAINDCEKNNWTLPKIETSNFKVVMEKNHHYFDMLMLDEKISKLLEGVFSDGLYNTLFNDCVQQRENIEKCIAKGWIVPRLSIDNPEMILAKVNMEREKFKTLNVYKKSLLKVAGAIGGVFIISVFCFIVYISGKVKVPLDALEMKNEYYWEVRDEFVKAGFDNIEVTEDVTGWKKSERVTKVTIGGSEKYSKGQYKKPDVEVVIFYSSHNRIPAHEVLEDWGRYSYKELQEALYNMGFRNIKINLDEYVTSDKDKNEKVAWVKINDKNYVDEECYIPSDAPIEIAYYTHKVSVGNEYSQLMGMKRGEVIAVLENRGFTNISSKDTINGWGQGDTVCEIFINGEKGFNAEDTFLPESSVEVVYYSNDRIEISSVLSEWNQKKYDDVERELRSRGFYDIKCTRKETDNVETNKNITNIQIGGSEETKAKYINGDCYVSTRETIWIEYCAVKIGIEGKLVGKEYKEVVDALKEKGFSNITLRRTNKVPFGKTAGDVKSIKVSGKEYDKKATYYFDEPIEIVVFTKKDGFDEISLEEE